MDPDDLLVALDPEQREVALAVRGPVCVLAGAGTGKTRAITHRIAYAVATGVVNPSQVLALTFTVRAAGELRGRLRALGGGAEAVIVPEIPFSLDDICDRVEDSHRRGKRSTIVVVSEGPRTGGVMPVAEALTARLGMQARVVVLGHVQRGGAPTARDRLLASRMGAGAVKAILDGAGPSLIGEERGAIVRVPLGEVANKRRPLDPSLIELVHQLST